MTRQLVVPGALVALALAGAGAGAGCGGKDQSAAEQSGTFKVDVVSTSFPRVQHLAEPSQFVAVVRNAGDRTIDDVAVTLQGFSTATQEPGAADPSRPVWVVDAGPTGGDTAYVDTWTLGRLAPGQTRRFSWRVSPIVVGAHQLHWRVSAGLTGKAETVTSSDEPPEGQLTVRIDGQPSQATVDPATGAVQRTQ